MFLVEIGECSWILKNGSSAFKSNTMFPEILFCFARVPLKLVLEQMGLLYNSDRHCYSSSDRTVSLLAADDVDDLCLF